MDFIFNDGGRSAAGYHGHTGDCVVRAVAIATETPYQTVYDALNALAVKERTGKRKRGVSNSRRGVYRATYQRYLESRGWQWVPTMGIGTGCKIHLVKDELPSGRLVVSLSRHLTAVIDGVIYDTHNPQREIHWIERDYGQELKPGQWRNANGICSIQRRCVYGYFQKKREA